MNKKLHILIAGGSGYIGQALTKRFLAEGQFVTVLTRNSNLQSSQENLSYVIWDGQNLSQQSKELGNIDVIINLAGHSIACVFNAKNKKLILESRVNATNALVSFVKNSATVPLFIQASAVGYYGNTGEHLNTETDPPGDTFKSKVCKAWEAAFLDVNLDSTRKVILRISPVVGQDSPFSEQIIKITKLFIGGAAGSGRQYISWISLDDLIELFLFCIRDQAMQGTYNAVSPQALRNKEFMQVLRQACRRPWVPPAPEFLVAAIARYILKKDPDLVLHGQKCSAEKLLSSSYVFKYPELLPLVRDLLKLKD